MDRLPYELRSMILKINEDRAYKEHYLRMKDKMEKLSRYWDANPMQRSVEVDLDMFIVVGYRFDQSGRKWFYFDKFYNYAEPGDEDDLRQLVVSFEYEIKN